MFTIFISSNNGSTFIVRLLDWACQNISGEIPIASD